MYCKRCGKEIEYNKSFCSHCGAPTGERKINIVSKKNESNPMSVVAFVFSFFPILCFLGFIFSFIGISKANYIGGKGKGLAIAALIISIINVSILFLVLYK